MQFPPIECVPKRGFIFVRMSDSLCFPFNVEVPPIALMGLVSSVVTAWKARDELFRTGADTQTAEMVMPVHRLFNRAKISSRFTVQDLPAFMQSVLSNATDALSIASEREFLLYEKLSTSFLDALSEVRRRF